MNRPRCIPATLTERVQRLKVCVCERERETVCDRLSGWLLLLCCHGSPQQFMLHSRRMGATRRSSAAGKRI